MLVFYSFFSCSAQEHRQVPYALVSWKKLWLHSRKITHMFPSEEPHSRRAITRWIPKSKVKSRYGKLEKTYCNHNKWKGNWREKYTLQLLATQPQIAPSSRQIVRSRDAHLGVLPPSWVRSWWFGKVSNSGPGMPHYSRKLRTGWLSPFKECATERCTALSSSVFFVFLEHAQEGMVLWSTQHCYWSIK